MQVALAMQVADRRAEVLGEEAELGGGEPAVATPDEVRERLPAERLEDDRVRRVGEDVVGAHEVRVAEPPQQAALAAQRTRGGRVAVGGRAAAT